MISFFEFSSVSDPLGMLAATGIFTVGALFFFPRPLMCIAAGVVLGSVAIPIALFGSTLGAAIGFLSHGDSLH